MLHARRLAGLTSTLLACVAAALGNARAEDAIPSLALRPAYQGTSYIRLLPDPQISSQFVSMIRTDATKAAASEAAGIRWHGQVEGVAERRAAGLPSGALYATTGLTRSTGTSYPYSYGVNVTVPLYDGGANGFLVSAQIAAAEAAEAGAVDSLAGTVLDLVAAATAMWVAQNTMSVRQSQLEAIENLAREVDADRTSGTASSVDSGQLRAEMVRIRLLLNAAQAARDSAQLSYSGVSGVKPRQTSELGTIGKFLPTSLNQALSWADQSNPKLSKQLDLAEAARFDHLSFQSSNGPDLNLNLSVGMDGDYQSGRSVSNTSALLRLEVPFSFGAEPATQRKALEAQAASFEAIAARNSIHASVESAFVRRASARSARSMAYDGLTQAQAVLAGSKVEYDLGERSVFDLISAQSAVAEARISIFSVEQEAVVAEHLLAAETGRLLDIYGLGVGIDARTR